MDVHGSVTFTAVYAYRLYRTCRVLSDTLIHNRNITKQGIVVKAKEVQIVIVSLFFCDKVKLLLDVKLKLHKTYNKSDHKRCVPNK